MSVKKKVSVLLIGALGICLFFTFGFQIGVDGEGSKDGGYIDVLLEPLKVAAKEANAALVLAQQAVHEAIKEQVLLLAQVPEATLEEKEAAQDKLDEAIAALPAAQLAASEANAEYLAMIAKDEEELLALLALQRAADEANAALDAAIIAGEDQAIIDDLQSAAEEASAALEETKNEEIKYFHIITNSNNGGSFDSEGNHTDISGKVIPFTFVSDPGFDLAWLRIGNIKIEATDDILPYLESFDKKNLTIHAHFKKNKNDVPGITDEDDGKKGNGNSKEKSNNGKKNKNK